MSHKLAKMSRCTYVEDGGEDEWSTLADFAFDPHNLEHGASESLVHHVCRGRGVGGRRGRAKGAMGGGRGQHPQGDIVALPPRARGVVTNHFMGVPLQPTSQVF